MSENMKDPTEGLKIVNVSSMRGLSFLLTENAGKDDSPDAMKVPVLVAVGEGTMYLVPVLAVVEVRPKEAVRFEDLPPAELEEMRRNFYFDSLYLLQASAVKEVMGGMIGASHPMGEGGLPTQGTGMS